MQRISVNHCWIFFMSDKSDKEPLIKSFPTITVPSERRRFRIYTQEFIHHIKSTAAPLRMILPSRRNRTTIFLSSVLVGGQVRIYAIHTTHSHWGGVLPPDRKPSESEQTISIIVSSTGWVIIIYLVSPFIKYIFMDRVMASKLKILCIWLTYSKIK